jgi:hypothetical protein
LIDLAHLPFTEAVLFVQQIQVSQVPCLVCGYLFSCTVGIGLIQFPVPVSPLLRKWGLLFLCEPRLYSQVGLRGAASPPYKGTVLGTPLPGPLGSCPGSFLGPTGLA